MNVLGCLFLVLAMLCIMAFFFVTAIWVVVGTFMLIAKLIVWMAYLGGAFLFIGLIAWLLAKLRA